MKFYCKIMYFCLVLFREYICKSKRNVRFMSNIMQSVVHREFLLDFETKDINCCCISMLDPGKWELI